MKQTVNLDCAPGAMRPGDLINGVLEGTGLTAQTAHDDKEKASGKLVSTFFGNWCWEFDVDREKWVNEIQPVIRPRIESLYHAGRIRYGDW